MKICLNMIVKNEAHIIEETLNSVLKYISYWVISDTGSTDNTKEIIKTFFEKHSIPGHLVEHQWKDFGSNRTYALEAAYEYRKNFDYIWVFDADDLVVGNLGFPTDKTVDIYSVKYGDDFTYMRHQIFKSSEKWKYVGVLHEYPSCISKKNPKLVEIKGDYYIDSRRLGARNKESDKYIRDAKILEQGLKDEPNNVRYMFYLGQSYMDAGDYKKAIKWYTKRAEKGGWFEEVYYSLYRIATNMEKDGQPWEKVEAAYIKAWKYLPSRAEPLYEIAKHYRIERNFEKGYKHAKIASTIPFPKDHVLFIFKDIYDYKVLDELSICAYYIGKHQENIDLCKRMLKEGLVPPHTLPRIQKNMEFSIKIIKENKEKEIRKKEIRKKKLKNKKLENIKISENPTNLLSIGLMASLVNDKFKEQIQGCQETWVKESAKLDIPIIYFCGNIRDQKMDSQIKNIIHLEGVKDDYASATYKQYYGLRYLLENKPAQFYLIGGTDNYINIQRCLDMLKKYDSKYPFLIGGHGENKNIFGYSCHYMTGGAGLFLSHSALSQLAPQFDDFIEEYRDELKDHKDKDACDVSLCHFARQENVTLVKEKDLYYCDWKGKCWNYDEFPCGGINYDKMIICHYMEREDMHLYNYWKDLNYNYGLIFRKFNKYSKDNYRILILHYYAKSASCIINCCDDEMIFYTLIKGLIDNLNTNERQIFYRDEKSINNEMIVNIGNFPIKNSNLQDREIEENSIDLIIVDDFNNINLNEFILYIKKGGYLILYNVELKQSKELLLNDALELEHQYERMTNFKKII